MPKFEEVLSKSTPPVLTYLAYNLDPKVVTEIACWMEVQGLPTTSNGHLKTGFNHCEKVVASEDVTTVTFVHFEPAHHQQAIAFRKYFS